MATEQGFSIGNGTTSTLSDTEKLAIADLMSSGVVRLFAGMRALTSAAERLAILPDNSSQPTPQGQPASTTNINSLNLWVHNMRANISSIIMLCNDFAKRYEFGTAMWRSMRTPPQDQQSQQKQ